VTTHFESARSNNGKSHLEQFQIEAHQPKRKTIIHDRVVAAVAVVAAVVDSVEVVVVRLIATLCNECFITRSFYVF